MGIGIIAMFTEFISRFNDITVSENRQIKSAIKHAVNHTRVHIARTRDKHGDIPSAILADVWTRTAQKIQEIDNEDVKNWGELLEQYELKLTQVEQRLNKFIQ